jgi:hypothetical protein
MPYIQREQKKNKQKNCRTTRTWSGTLCKYMHLQFCPVSVPAFRLVTVCHTNLVPHSVRVVRVTALTMRQRDTNCNARESLSFQRSGMASRNKSFIKTRSTTRETHCAIWVLVLHSYFPYFIRKGMITVLQCTSAFVTLRPFDFHQTKPELYTSS